MRHKLIKTEEESDLCYLATKRAEAKRIKEASATDFTSVCNTFTDSRLRSFIKEHNLCTVDDICLNTGDVYILLYLIHSHHVVI